MTERTRMFFEEMAALMEKHGVTEIEVVETDSFGGYDTQIDGIEFTFDAQYKDNEMKNEMEFERINGTWFDVNDFRVKSMED